MQTPHNRRLIKNALERRAQWKRMYSDEYFRRFFTLYDGELEALLDLAMEHDMKVPHECKPGCTIMPLDHLPEGSF